jgi:hypothetical protein
VESVLEYKINVGLEERFIFQAKGNYQPCHSYPRCKGYEAAEVVVQGMGGLAGEELVGDPQAGVIPGAVQEGYTW